MVEAVFRFRTLESGQRRSHGPTITLCTVQVEPDSTSREMVMQVARGWHTWIDEPAEGDWFPTRLDHFKDLGSGLYEWQTHQNYTG